MSSEETELKGPDLAVGILFSSIGDGQMLLGHSAGKPVLLCRRGDDLFAIGAMCSHYGASLADGLMVGDTVRCPAHHACFSLRTGHALRAPALKPVSLWTVERSNGSVFVRKEREADDAAAMSPATENSAPSSVLILGGGAAGDAAAQRLRTLGYGGPITLVSADADAPCDRPNLSKDYLAGSAPEEWIPLRPEGWYAEHDIELVLDVRATALDVASRQVRFSDGSTRDFGALLLATGASPVRLPETVADPSRVHYLRTLADSRSIIKASAHAERAVVLGASFIALEAAAALRQRNTEVHIVAPDERPLERVLGRDIGDHIRKLHEEHGVVFHLQRTATRIDAGGVTLSDGQRIDAELVIAGIGVKPEESIAAAAGLRCDRGIVVDEYLRTSARGIYAAGDVARYPDPASGSLIRVEHWVVAQRMGQTAAANILGAQTAFDAVPFFWSQHYDLTLHYVGHAESWDALDVDGDIPNGDFTATYRAGGVTRAVVTAGRDRADLEAEVEMERAQRARQSITEHAGA